MSSDRAGIVWTILICMLLLVGGCGESANLKPENLLTGRVTGVVSGQTLLIKLVGDTEPTKVRIIGIEAPDLRQAPWGKAAQDKLLELVMGESVLIEKETAELDFYHRLLGHVWWQNHLVSQQLVEMGCVLADDKYLHSYSKLLGESQAYARLMGYGIWNPNQAMRRTPSQFRSQNN